ncbi:hypothetical protein MFRU_009g02110 [Monilinia fructicola]|nr:hypothetical protein MFRU_009g02110 [Monilinia fructicola]
MADKLLSDRQDVPIWSAIEAGNLKQALKLVDKKLAKKRTSHLEALKIYIRSRSSVQSERDAVLAHLEDLVAKKAIITDQEDIDLYDDALVNAIPEAGSIWARTIGELRWQSVKAYPKQEDSGLKSFKACLSERDWEHAQQIASSLEKTFPNKHQYVFWNISSLFIRSMSGDLPIEKRTLWGRLAFGQISKLATATIQADKSKSLPTRAIHTPQELLLLQRITAAHGKLEDQLKYLNEPSLGPESIVAKGDWELWRNKLQLMEASEHWQQLFETTGDLLKRARTKDERGEIVEARMADWAVWQAYLRSALALQTSSTLDSVSTEVAAHLNPASGIDKTWKRNASLAWLEFTFKNSSTPFATDPSESDLEKYPRVTAIIKYLQGFGDATTAYSDLRPYVELLQTDERSKLLEILRSGLQFGKAGKTNDLEAELKTLSISKNEFENANDITRCVNLHKLTYLIISSIAEHERRSSPLRKAGELLFTCTYCSSSCEVYCGVCLEKVSKDSIAAYTSAIDDNGKISKSLLPTDRHPADDFCTLAAMCLMKLSTSGSNDTDGSLKSKQVAYALQAAVFLEYGWSRSKSNSDFSLLLVRLYSSLGCGQQAMKAYLHLSLKQIQLDTLGYSLLDRISSLHPHAFLSAPDGSSENLSPVDHLKNQRKMYRSCRYQVANNTWKAFEHGSYNTIFQFQEFSDIISHTISAVSSAVETTKISRFLKQNAPSDVFEILPKNPEMLEKFSDSNDYTSFPDYESTLGLGLEKLTRFAPGPSSNRSRGNLLAEKLITLITFDSTQPLHLTSFRETLLRISTELQKQVDLIKASPEGAFLTRSETSVLTAYINLATIIYKASDPTSSSTADFPSSLETSNESLKAALQEHLSLIKEAHDTTPALWNTLHTLYTSSDLASTIIQATKFLARKDVKAHKSQVEQSKGLVESATQILEAVVEKSKVIKDGLDESGWIDRVLESMEARGPGEQLRNLVGENFVEEWAGFVVEGWRESVTGLGLLKV